MNYKPEHLKVGSIWQYRPRDWSTGMIKVRIIKVIENKVYYEFIEHYAPNIKDTSMSFDVYGFLADYQLIYTVEGFEV